MDIMNNVRVEVMDTEVIDTLKKKEQLKIGIHQEGWR